MRRLTVIFFGSLLLVTSHGFAVENCSKDKTLYEKGQDFFGRGQFLLASTQFSLLSASACTESWREKGDLGFALSMLEIGETDETLIVLHRLEKGSDGLVFKQAQFVKGYLMEGGNTHLGPAEQSRIRLWKSRFDADGFKEELDQSALSPADKTKLSSVQTGMLAVRPKSPVAAGILSAFLPGAGQAYVGAWQSAALAVVLNGLFLATTLEFAKHDMPWATASSTMVFSVAYIGNILNAVQGAHKVNDGYSRPYEQRLRNDLLPELKP